MLNKYHFIYNSPTDLNEEVVSEIRLDKFIINSTQGLSRSQLQNRIDQILVNGRKAKLSMRLNGGEEVELTLKPIELPSFSPEKIPLNILYEDDDSLVIDKIQGMVVHPGAGHHSGTLVNALLGACLLDNDLAQEYDGVDEATPFRPGIVHRIDKDTSGLILVAKNMQAHQYYSSLFRKKKVKKQYLAIIRGTLPKKEGVIESWMARDRKNRKRFEMTKGRGKEAITRYRVLSEANGFSLVALSPITGRTHQLRVHMSGTGFPILGDPLYSRKDKRFGEVTLMLHAWRFVFFNYAERKKIRVESELPTRFFDILNQTGLQLNLEGVKQQYDEE